MANTNSPYGLKPERLHGAAVPNESARIYYVPAGNSNALYVGDAVVKVAGSASPNGQYKGIDLCTTAANAAITGVIAGFAGVATSGDAVVNPTIPMTFGNIYRPASTAQDYYALVIDDPSVEYSIQMDSTNVLPISSIGKGAGLTYGAGSAYTGLSGTTLANSTVSDTGALSFVIVGFDTVTNNDPASAYAKVTVRLNSSTEVNGQAGI